jgi:hypothetical protein
MSDGDAFEPPPEGTGRSRASDADEDAGLEFRPPGDAQAQAEEAAAAPGPAELTAVPPALLDAKNRLADVLRQQGAERAQAEAFADVPSGTGTIQGVAIGVGEPTGPPGASALFAEPGQPTLTVYVTEPTHPEQVQAMVVDDLGVSAAASDDVPVQPVVTGIIDAQPHRFRLRPAPGGISVAHFKVTAGTFGCLTIGRTPPRNQRPLILSNNHVLANVNNAVFGDCVCQPGPADGGACPGDQVAILERFVPLSMGGPVNYVDCATAWAWPDRVRRELMYLSGGQPAYFRIGSQPVAAQLGMAVGKSGRTTQVTSGRITAINASLWVSYGGGRSAFFEDQISIQGASGNFSAGGDSGSMIWTWDGNRSPVGLLYAGGGGVTFANKIQRVLNALDLSLYT